MNRTIQTAYWGVMMGLIVTALVLRRVTAVRALQRQGAGPFTGLFTPLVYAEMRAYRKLCEREGASLIWWRLWWALHLATVAMLLGWFALLAVMS